MFTPSAVHSAAPHLRQPARTNALAFAVLHPSWLSLRTGKSRPCVCSSSPFHYVHYVSRALEVARGHIIAEAVRMQSGGGSKGQKGRRKSYSPRIENRIARFRYDIVDSYECGIELLGTEVKSVRNGQMNIKEGYARVKDGQIFLHNVNISTWQGSHKAFNHDPIRTRRLLLHKRIIRRLASKQTDTGLTIIPLTAYFASNGYLKVEIALAKGKKLHDKREDEKKREAQRDIQRAVKSFVAR